MRAQFSLAEKSITRSLLCLAVQEGVILVGASEADIPEYDDNGTVYVFTSQAEPSVFLHLPVVRH